MQLRSLGSAAPGGCVPAGFPRCMSSNSRLQLSNRCNSTLMMFFASTGRLCQSTMCSDTNNNSGAPRRRGGHLIDMAVCAAIEAAEPAEPHKPSQPARYTGSDGRPKATFEEAFRLGRIDGNMRQMPWQLSWQRNESTLKLTDDTQAHLVKGFALRELHISEHEMELRLRQLALLLPDIAAKISVMKPQAVAYFAADTNRLALGLVRLKQIFPSADVASMVVKQPALLLECTPEQLMAAAEQLRQLLPRFDIDWLLEQHPQIVLDVDNFAQTLSEAKRMLPDQDVMHTLAHNPNMIFGFERRNSMIPYDS